MHSAISINTLSLGASRLGDHVERVARLGAGAISPTLEEVLDCGVARAREHVANAGLAIATLTHRAFAFSTPSEAQRARDRLNRSIAIAEQIGAQSITLTSGGRGQLNWDDAAERFVQEIAACAQRAREAGVVLSLEPTSHLYADVSIAHRLSDAVRLARGAAIGVGIDIFACWCDADIETAIAEAARACALVQVSDYVLGDRSLPCRAVPGDGAIPLASLIGRIAKTGYRGYYDLEIIGPRLASPDIDTNLRRAGAALEAML